MMWHVRGYASMHISITTPSCLPPFDITPRPPSADFIPPFENKWRAMADEDGHYCFALAL
jgi:hypothetical protein